RSICARQLDVLASFAKAEQSAAIVNPSLISTIPIGFTARCRRPSFRPFTALALRAIAPPDGADPFGRGVGVARTRGSFVVGGFDRPIYEQKKVCGVDLALCHLPPGKKLG